MGPVGVPELIILLLFVGLPTLLVVGIVRVTGRPRCSRCGKRLKTGRPQCPSCGADFRRPELPV